MLNSKDLLVSIDSLPPIVHNTGCIDHTQTRHSFWSIGSDIVFDRPCVCHEHKCLQMFPSITLTVNPCHLRNRGCALGDCAERERQREGGMRMRSHGHYTQKINDLFNLLRFHTFNVIV